MYNELLWIFTQLPDDYIVLDTETTGLPDENGPPDIVTLGITVVKSQEITQSVEFKTRPRKHISDEAQALHGISNDEAAEYASFASQWSQIADCLKDQLIVIHNASFDWPILLDHVHRCTLIMPAVNGIFCSQTAAIAWARSMGFPCSQRGPSLETLTKSLNMESLRDKQNGIHGAQTDSLQLATLLEVLRCKGHA